MHCNNEHVQGYLGATVVEGSFINVPMVTVDLNCILSTYTYHT